MAKQKGWGRSGAAGLANGDYILQFVEFGNRNSQGRPELFEFEEREGSETPAPRAIFRVLVLDGPMKIGDVLSISQKYGGIDEEDGEIVFRCKGANPPAFIRWISAFGMRFPTEDSPGDTILTDPPDPSDPSSILQSLETILKERAKQGCLAQARVGEYEAFGQTIKGRFIWDSVTAVPEKLARMFLEGTRVTTKESEHERLQEEIKAMVRTLQAAGEWSFADAREHLKEEYGVKAMRELNLGALRDFYAYVRELGEEKGVELFEEL